MSQNNKLKLRWLYICPKCGNIIFKTEKYIEEVATIKCQKCKKIFSFEELLVKRI